jgi:hypothetical protein
MIKGTPIPVHITFSIPGPPPPEEAPLFWRKLLGCFVWAKVLEHVYVKNGVHEAKLGFQKRDTDFVKHMYFR